MPEKPKGKLLYADGGVISKNPSQFGGTYAWCLVDGDCCQIEKHGSGFVRREDYPELPYISNNFTEVIAVLRGLQNMERKWSGTVYTDSLNTIRFFKTYTFRPKWIPESIWAERLKIITEKDFGTVEYVLLGGHPTKAQLTRGFRNDGKPVSIFNVWCDKKCRSVGKQNFRQALGYE